MAVRVKVELEPLGEGPSIESAGLLNSGFEGEGVDILVPHEVAVRLGFLPTLPAHATLKDFETAGGSVRMYTLREAIRVRIKCDDRSTDFVTCNLIISELEREIVLSDQLIDALNISLESPGKGLWKFKDDTTIRTSIKEQYW